MLKCKFGYKSGMFCIYVGMFVYGIMILQSRDKTKTTFSAMIRLNNMLSNKSTGTMHNKDI